MGGLVAGGLAAVVDQLISHCILVANGFLLVVAGCTYGWWWRAVLGYGGGGGLCCVWW